LIPSKERAKGKETGNRTEGQKRRVIMSRRGRWWGRKGRFIFNLKEWRKQRS